MARTAFRPWLSGAELFLVHANHRTDAYGGDAAGRRRFLLETLADVRAVWPERLPLTARFGDRIDGRDEETLGDPSLW
jgi:2,4-dienoyl-CoA reductase-like NADH-dependent reductase (Old Yellow Enzyme family)